VVVSKDEGIRVDAGSASLAGLRPSFRPDGTITAGSSSPLSDGAAAVVITSRQTAQRLGLTWLAQIGSHASVAGPDSTLQLQPARAVAAACARSGLAPTDLDLLEINEAFAAVGYRQHPAPRGGPRPGQHRRRRDRPGHPLGMSGARVAFTWPWHWRGEAGGIGAAAVCGGGGQARRCCCAFPSGRPRPRNPLEPVPIPTHSEHFGRAHRVPAAVSRPLRSPIPRSARRPHGCPRQRADVHRPWSTQWADHHR